MTSEERDILIEKMIDKPETLTSDEIAMIASDKELREIYEISAQLADEMMEIPEVDEDAEWLEFKGMLIATRKRSNLMRWWIGVAAVFAAILIGGVVARYILTDNEPVITPYVAKVIPVADAVTDCAKDSAVIPQANKQVIKRSPIITGQDHKDEKEDFDEYLRIEQARVDNEVAVALARVYQEEYSVNLEALADILENQELNDSIKLVPTVNVININQLTML